MPARAPKRRCRARVGLDRGAQLLLAEVGPERLREDELRVRGLPEHEVREPELARGAHEQVQVGELGRVQPLRDRPARRRLRARLRPRRAVVPPRRAPLGRRSRTRSRARSVSRCAVSSSSSRIFTRMTSSTRSRRPRNRVRTPCLARSGSSPSIVSESSTSRSATSSAGRAQFSVENAYTTSVPMPSSIAASTVRRSALVPARWPSATETPCSSAQRPLPSITTATVLGTPSRGLGGSEIAPALPGGSSLGARLRPP